jgi:hypothetical protein
MLPYRRARSLGTRRGTKRAHSRVLQSRLYSPFVCLSTSRRATLRECRSRSERQNWSNAKAVEHKRRASPRGSPFFRHECPVAFAGLSRSIGHVKFSSAPCGKFGKARHCVDMPAPSRNHVQVVRCKGCKRCVPISVEAVIGSVTVACPMSWSAAPASSLRKSS